MTATPTTPSGPLRAVRRVLEPGPAVDPYELAGDSGIVFDAGPHALVGLGRALVLPLAGGLDDAADIARAGDQLAAVPCADDLGRGSGVVAFGSLPFDRREPAALVVPELIYGREPDGCEWLTVVGTAGDGPPAAGARAWLLAGGHHDRAGRSGDARGRRNGPSPAAPLRPAVAAARAGLADPSSLGVDAGFATMVGTALERIRAGHLRKVVLSRHVDLALGSAPELPQLLRRWRELEPSCTVFSLPTAEGRFVGASPELLVCRTGSRVVSRPLAGTSGPAERDGSRSLLDSSKDAVEHRLVVDAIGTLLAPRCTELDVPDQPDLVRLRSVDHLGTTITGTLRDLGGAPPSALDLVAVLHPTPAVGGVPTAAALATIAELEPARRGVYAGAVGYVDGAGDGEWVVGIRAAVLSEGVARLAAGVGIVDGSEPGAELDETTWKLMAVVDALTPGAPPVPGRQAG